MNTIPRLGNEARRINPGDALHAMEYFPDFSKFMTTMLTLDDDKLFQAQAEFRKLTSPGIDPAIRNMFITVSLHVFCCHKVLWFTPLLYCVGERITEETGNAVVNYYNARLLITLSRRILMVNMYLCLWLICTYMATHMFKVCVMNIEIKQWPYFTSHKGLIRW